jgi:RNA polymerase sigma-70 factor (ECF subfamily)
MDEQEAVRRLKKGDSGGLEYLVLAHQVRAIRMAYLITGDRGLAEEVVQEAFLRAYRSIGTFDPDRPFEPWFLRSVVNASVRLVKRAKREVALERPEAEQAFQRMAAQLDSPDAQLEAAETERAVREALDGLSLRQRAVIVQRYFLGMSEAEMASESGTAAGTIKWLLNAARRRLRGVLAERSDE